MNEYDICNENLIKTVAEAGISESDRNEAATRLQIIDEIFSNALVGIRQIAPRKTT